MRKFTWILFILLFAGSCAYAQWVDQASGFTTASRGIRSVYAVSSTVVWASAYDGSGAGVPCQDITMTTNGGTLWTPHTVAGVTNLDIGNIVAIDASTAWVCMFPPGATATGQGIYKTTNGGTTWSRQATATFSNASSFADLVYFWDLNLGYCMGDPINGEFEIYTTTNGGTTWTLVPGANIPNPLSGEWGVTGYYSSIGNITWFGTNLGRIYKSIDYGNTWTVSAIPGWGAKYVQPFFRDALNGLVQDKTANTTGALVKTTDGGTTWTPVVTTGSVFANDFSFVPGTASTWVSTGAATGYTGVTYSFNDGVTWNDMTATIGTQFLATDWINASTGWAGAFNTSATVGGMRKFNSVLAQPVANFIANVTNITIGGQVLFTDLSTGGPTSWLWSFPGGTPATSTLQTPPAITYNTAGQYNVTLTVTNSWGTAPLVKTNYIVVSSTAPPIANFSANQTNILTGGQVQFTDLSTGTPTGWSWSFPGGTPATSTLQTPPFITYNTAGQYNVSLTVTNSMGNNTNTKTNYITVVSAASPVADFTASLTTIVTGGLVQFTDLSTNTPTSWSWTFPGGTPGSSTLQTPPLIHYNTAGQYDVTLTVVNIAGSTTKTKIQYITVMDPPLADFTASQTNIMTGGQIQFTDMSSGNPTSWNWSFQGGTPNFSYQQVPPPVTYSTAGVYDVTLTVTNPIGINTKGKFQYIKVSNPPPPVADFTADHTNIPVGGHVQFSDLSTGNPTSWQWTFQGGTPGTSTQQTPPPIVYTISGQYDVTLTATNLGGPNVKTKVNYIIVGLTDIPEAGQLSTLVFPNPANEFIVVKSNSILINISVINQFGDVMLRAAPGSRDYVIHLENVPAGLYFLQITAESGNAYKKVVVSK